MTTLKDILEILINGGIEPNEASVELKIMIEHFANYGYKDIILGNPLSPEKIELVKEKAELRVKTREPIQYITGYADFMGEKFIVNSNVLIPRDETELLVRNAIELIKENNFKMALDVGTGTGCIACMVAKHTQCQIIGLDISTEALQTALDNASRLNLYNKAIFRKSDIFSNVKPNEKFDIIISNPPYIPISEKSKIQPEVSFEPELALYAKDDKGLEYYEKIISEAPKILNNGGYLIFEVGMGQAQYVKKIFEENKFEGIEIKKDLAEIERVVFARKNG